MRPNTAVAIQLWCAQLFLLDFRFQDHASLLKVYELTLHKLNVQLQAVQLRNSVTIFLLYLPLNVLLIDLDISVVDFEGLESCQRIVRAVSLNRELVCLPNAREDD